MKRVVVTLTDKGYYHKVKRTIADIRSRGEWTEDLVLITEGFDAPSPTSKRRTKKAPVASRLRFMPECNSGQVFG